MNIRRFQELHVYRTAFETANLIFEYSRQWPKEEKYALTDQIRRSSRSICANIAEAWSKRRYPKHFVSKLTDADAETSETRVWIDFALQCSYLTSSEAAELIQFCNRISGGLIKMTQSPDDWCRPSKFVKEPAMGYNTPDHSSLSPPVSPSSCP